MKVEITEKRLSSDGFVGENGDRFTVPDEVGQKWCALGWAIDLSGACETGERKVIDARLDVDDISQSTKTEVK
jgi:hypothetical protein